MKTGYIRFSETNNKPTIEVKLIDGTVWMTINEIADLFRVNIPIINKQLKTIFKDHFLRENEVTKEYRYACPKNGECIRTYYNLEIIIFLSFRIQSLYTKAFREWVIYSLVKNKEAISSFVDYRLIAEKFSYFNWN